MREAEDLQLIMIRGIVAGLPVEDRVKVDACAVELRKAVAAAGEHGKVAAALVGAELAAE